MVQSTSHMCLEVHKHKGTTFQGTQISTQFTSMISCEHGGCTDPTYISESSAFDYPSILIGV
jgi:hypothetical protein